MVWLTCGHCAAQAFANLLIAFLVGLFHVFVRVFIGRMEDLEAGVRALRG